jgi:hypothetical protein
MKEKQHLTSEGLDKIRQIKAGMNRGRINSTVLPSSKRLMSTTRNVDSEEVIFKIDLASVVKKPYLDKTHSKKGCREKDVPDSGVSCSKVNSIINIYGSGEAKEGKGIILYVLNYLRAYIISASKLGEGESPKLNTASLLKGNIRINLEILKYSRAALSKVKAILLEVYLIGASLIGLSLARDGTNKFELGLVN